MKSKSSFFPFVITPIVLYSTGTYNKDDNTGGSNGATMRFAPESTDDANAGLGIVRDLLLPIKKAHPEVSYADLWVLSGHVAIEFLGGPKVPFRLGRTDARDGATCPANGRLPDAAQGMFFALLFITTNTTTLLVSFVNTSSNICFAATLFPLFISGAAHLRDVFHRMGFSDKEIVCLSGAHTLGRCHKTRSGFDGPWTNNPLSFDNNYFRLLSTMTWQKRNWDGPEQYEDKETKKLMMLPTDMALMTDDKFRPHVLHYAKNEEAFFDDFSDVFAKLTSLGCPFDNGTIEKKKDLSVMEQNSKDFREYAMHGTPLQNDIIFVYLLFIHLESC